MALSACDVRAGINVLFGLKAAVLIQTAGLFVEPEYLTGVYILSGFRFHLTGKQIASAFPFIQI